MAKIENTIESISALIDMMTQKGVKEIELADDTMEIRIEMNCGNAPIITAAPVATAPAQTVVSQPHGNIMKAPIVGTFYAAASPDEKPFASVGQRVSKGDILFIIESMKVMNEVKSEFDGTVVTINCKNGEAVEFDQPVMIIE